MHDPFQQGLMLGRVLELSEHTAAKVDLIDARQTDVIRRIERLESSPRLPLIPRPLLAAGAALAGLAANLNAEQLAALIRALLHSLGSGA